MTALSAHAAVVSIIFLFFALIVGAALLYIFSRLHNVIPYTVTIFIFGILVSILAQAVIGADIHDVLMEATQQWINIDSNLLLGAFLPPLLFGEAMHLNFYQVKVAFAPAFLLAWPGAAFGAFMLALCCYYTLPEPIEWSWRLSFIVGAILSATDPVSVISTLKGLSSSSTSTMKLTYLIVGEALLNDGVAIVLFDALTSLEYSTPKDIVVFFIKVLFISPLLGLALGLGCIAILRIADRRVSHDDNTVQIAATIACAYVSFFLAQFVLDVSGVISTITSGVVLAWLAPPLILQPHSMHAIWEFLEWIGNTLIFIIAGLLVGSYIINYSQGFEYGLIFVVYIYMFLIRLLLLVICYPAMTYLSKGYSWNDVFFSVFAGLRGAISLALVIVIQGNINSTSGPDTLIVGISFPKDQVRQVVFIICGVVALTILINGTFSKAFYVFLYTKVDAKTVEADSVMLHYVRKRIWQRAEDGEYVCFCFFFFNFFCFLYLFNCL